MRKSIHGQATVEYILILAFATIFGLRASSLFGDLFRDSMGSVAHVLSLNLNVGVCKNDCYFGGYYNGYTGEM